MEVTDSIKKLLDKAKIGLMQKADSAFFTTIVFSLKFLWDDTQPTAYTNGKTIGFNPDFFLSLSPDERVGVLVHEACHVAYMHMDRLETRDHEVFNDAADHVINLMLLASGFKLPSWVLKDERFAGLGTEQVYTILKAEKIEQEMNGSAKPDPNGMPDLRKPEGSSGELVKEIEEMIIRAKMYSEMANETPGSIPGDIIVYLDKLLNPVLPWQTILRKYLNSFDKHDYSWKKPNRRHLPDNYLPSLYGESLMDLVIAVDISGSVSDSDFLRFVSEIAGIFRMMKPKQITVVQFDTAICSVHKVKSVKELTDIDFKGRGGTDIVPVLEWAEVRKPQLLMVFTDGDFSIPKKFYKTNVLWLIHNEPSWQLPTCANGKVIHYKI